jgi:hypothetical protein
MKTYASNRGISIQRYGQSLVLLLGKQITQEKMPSAYEVTIGLQP